MVPANLNDRAGNSEIENRSDYGTAQGRAGASSVHENARLGKGSSRAGVEGCDWQGFVVAAATQRPPKIRKMPRRGWLGKAPLVLAIGLSLAVIRVNSGARPAS